ncbi:hypothetical protein C8R47DRAFT_1093072 [Mycena vitilis]|nr:hypothetical protein C8R47DRAFT_1093072 [Mycena vitilis]
MMVIVHKLWLTGANACPVDENIFNCFVSPPICGIRLKHSAHCPPRHGHFVSPPNFPPTASGSGNSSQASREEGRGSWVERGAVVETSS